MTRGTILSVSLIGLSLACCDICTISFKSPNKNLYGFPFKPCSLRLFSMAFGRNQTQFRNLHPYTATATTAATATPQYTTLMLMLITSISNLNLGFNR
ncbi:hypothetical protein HanXRQr2_Chr17g0789961 [Helianthus annuus]|uniref:Secreted protein n=1 Tax=Helianthus annuus TaxID=4232 RepID=A0A9K3GSL6_HELAN|nr:hypothetical protein HanXRQr2_Chr17g0789961 [Helianthus annuus]